MKIVQIVEALPLATAKTYRKAWDPSFHKAVFERQPVKDKNAYRIYIPFETTSHKKVVVPKLIQDFLRTAIPNKPYETNEENYVKGVATEVANPTRQIGIGKMIARNLSQIKDPVDQHQLQQLKKDFDNDPQRKASKSDDKLIAISRHPYDVAGMSTDRGWRSCMNLVDGINKHYVIHDVREGCIIAYLIDADDKNINHPQARILIKPYRAKDDPTDLVMMGDAVYGTAPAHFEHAVTDWVNKNYNQGKSGLYCISPKLYRDYVPTKITMISDDEFATMPVKNVIKIAKGKQGYARIARLRADADDILWQIAMKNDTSAARYLKNIDFEKFVKAFNQNNHILAFMHTITPQMKEYALKKTPWSLMFFKDRTPEQEKTLNDLVKKDPFMIPDVVNPTQEQIITAVTKDISLLPWALENHPDAVDINMVTEYINFCGRKTSREYDDDVIGDDTLRLILRSFPQVVRDDTTLGKLATLNGIKLLELAPLSDEQISKVIPKLREGDYYYEDPPARASLKVQQVLSKMTDVAKDPSIMQVLVRRFPDLVGNIPDVTEKDLKKALGRNPGSILKWNNLSDELIASAIINDDGDHGLTKKFTPRKYPGVWKILIKNDPGWLFGEKDLPKELLMQVVNLPKLSYFIARHLLNDSNADMGIKVRLIKRNPKWIGEVTKPSLALQLAAINTDPEVYERIKPKDRHPAAKAYMAVYRKEMRKLK